MAKDLSFQTPDGKKIRVDINKVTKIRPKADNREHTVIAFKSGPAKTVVGKSHEVAERIIENKKLESAKIHAAFKQKLSNISKLNNRIIETAESIRRSL